MAEPLVSVPRSALQALAEWAYPIYASARIWGKLPPRSSRWTSWRIDDDLHQALLGTALKNGTNGTKGINTSKGNHHGR